MAVIELLIQSNKLATARICLNCDEVYWRRDTCPSCTSPSWHLLSKWINRSVNDRNLSVTRRRKRG